MSFPWLKLYIVPEGMQDVYSCPPFSALLPTGGDSECVTGTLPLASQGESVTRDSPHGPRDPCYLISFSLIYLGVRN